MVAVLHWEGFCWVACWASFVGPTYRTLKDSEGLQRTPNVFWVNGRRPGSSVDASSLRP